jgi:hypothetical protein
MEALLAQLMQIILALTTLISSYGVVDSATQQTVDEAIDTVQQATIAVANTQDAVSTNANTTTPSAPTAPASTGADTDISTSSSDGASLSIGGVTTISSDVSSDVDTDTSDVSSSSSTSSSSSSVTGTQGQSGSDGQDGADAVTSTSTDSASDNTELAGMDGFANTDTVQQGQLFWGNAPSYGPALAGLPKQVGDSTFNVGPTSMSPRHDGVGAFRSVCATSHFLYDDPVVYPGQVGRSHLHMFFGNTGADAHSTYQSLRSSGNSTCRGGIAVRSAYWVPAMLDGPQGKPLSSSAILLYYKTGYSGVTPANVQHPPDGLRMLAGDSLATAPQSRQVVAWSCSGQPWVAGGIPACVGELTMAVDFPQCWDGKNLDSPDHQSHMAYPIPPNGCPASHPVGIPVITYHVPYSAPNGTAGWRLSSDMYDTNTQQGGYSSHADWFDGWDPDIKRMWTKNCLQAGDDCTGGLLGEGQSIQGSGGGLTTR